MLGDTRLWDGFLKSHLPSSSSLESLLHIGGNLIIGVETAFDYRGTSLIRAPTPVGLYISLMPKDLL